MTKQAQMFIAMLSDGAEGSGPFAEDGAATGIWEYVAEGHVRARGVFVDGQPHGVWRVWDARGFLRSQSEWQHGVPCGRWITWNKDGNLERVDVKGDSRPDPALVVLAERAHDDTMPV